MAGKGQPKTGGRKPGVTNKTTLQAREAIAMFVDNNAHRLEGWLDRVAEESPEKAFQLFQSVIEYHIPKLARTDNTTQLKGDLPSIQVQFVNTKPE